MLQQAIDLNRPFNRVELPDGRAVDLAGKPHPDSEGNPIPTPHTHCPKPANPAPYDQFPPGRYAIPRPSTIDDIQDVIDHLLNNINSFFNPAPVDPEYARAMSMTA
jgi:hypothetical protein